MGRLPPPKGQKDEDWEDREQLLFRATAFGDEVDRPLLKSDGSFTYFASDIAYHRSKFERGFASDDRRLGRRPWRLRQAHAGGREGRSPTSKGDLDVKLCQLVKLLRGGEPVKMSKRSGDFVTLREVVDEVGRDAVRFMMIFRKNDATLDFDLAKVVEQSKDNPVFYVQYAHARCASVFRQAGEAFPRRRLLGGRRWRKADLSILSDEAEMDVIHRIAQFPRMIEAAAEAHEPHRVAFYLYDLASAFHSFGIRAKTCRNYALLIKLMKIQRQARLALVHALKGVLASGLAILGVTAPDEMR